MDLRAPHPIAGRIRVTIDAVRELAPVIPHSQEAVTAANRKIRLPLRTGRGIGVQLERCAKSETTVGRANVKDVAGVAASRRAANKRSSLSRPRRRAVPSPRAAR